MIFSNLFIGGILMSLAIALPRDERRASTPGGRMSKMRKYGRRSPPVPAIFSPLPSDPAGSSSASPGQSEGVPVPGDSQPSTGETAPNAGLQSPSSADGLYSIANVTIHQYPLSDSTTNGNTQSPIGEDVSLWISNMDNKKPNFATEAFCNLTWVASTANPAGPPATGQMACVSREPNSSAVSKGLPNYSARWNVTFQQQTISPLSGFNVIASSSSMMGSRDLAIWAPRNLSDDVAWQINENYFRYPGLAPFGKAVPSQPITSRSSPDVPNDQIKVADLTNSTTAKAAAGDSGSPSGAPNDQIKVADLNNQATAKEAANAPPAAPAVPNDQIKVADLTNSTTAKAAAGDSGSSSQIPSDQIKVADLNNQATAKEAANAPPAAPAVPNDQIQVSDLGNKAVANAAANAPLPSSSAPSDQIEVSDLTNLVTASKAADDSSAAVSPENDQIQVADLSNKGTANAAANAPPANQSPPSDQIQVADLSNKDTAKKAANAPPPTSPTSTTAAASITSIPWGQR